MTRLKADSLTHKLVDEIADMILDGCMSAGDRLPSMAELGERFGVSYTVLREALRVLEARGMVEIQHGKGTVVTLDPSGAMAISFRSIGRMHDNPHEHLMEVRSILEVEIARLAAIRRRADDMRELEDAIAALAKSLDDPDAFVKADTRFHYSVVAASHNPLLIKIMQSLREVQTHQWEATTRMREGDLEEAYAVHRLVFESIRDRDPGGAVEAMRQLLAVASADLQRLMSMQAEDSEGKQ